jgi:hypothetical protein
MESSFTVCGRTILSVNKQAGAMMLSQQSEGPFCQSCGMPLEKPEDFGTGANGFRINDYCIFVFKRVHSQNRTSVCKQWSIGASAS